MKGFNFDYEFSHFLDMKDEELGNKTWSEEDLRQLAEHFFALGKVVGKNKNPMTDEQIVEAAKKAEQKTRFGELVHSQVSRGVNSAFGIGFLEGAEFVRKQYEKN